MRKKALTILLLIILFACKSKKNVPDVSNIQVDINVERFEKSFFQIDTNDLLNGLKKVQQLHPAFFPDFMQGILQINNNDTSPPALMIIKNFLSSYRGIYDTLQQLFKNTGNVENQIEGGFQFVKYYFPNYAVPGIITFIGPLDAPGIALTNNYIAVGLHQFAGKNFSAYQSMESQQLYPSYIVRRFEPQYIAVNCMKIVGEDLFPDKSTGRPLIEQMIENGKKLYLLDHFMPSTPDSTKTGYTKEQLQWCDQNEGLIWNYIIQNEDLHSIDPVVIQTYIGESPFTQNMPESSPGNIGQWVGWQIIKRFAEKNAELKIEEIMKAEPKQILEEAKYKPK